MIPAELIRKKREGEELNENEIKFLVEGASKGSIPDYQLSAWLMAVYFKSMGPQESFWLTQAMKNSGKTYHWKKTNPKLEGYPLIDKHSTGGVGDKVSLILVALAVELGLKVPMMSGRGLGHTGGTVDKLLSIPGFKMDIAEERAAKILEEVGCCMLAQTADLCPADKKLYHLRDVTATVESYPLITGSIVSKKWAEGCEGIVYDVKFGSGAFMPTLDTARELSHWLLKVSKLAGLNAEACVSHMEELLGSCIGNALEVEESIWIMKNKYPSSRHKEIAKPLALLCCQIAARMAILGKTRTDYEKTVQECEALLESGKTFIHFDKLVRAQGAIANWEKELPQATQILEIKATEDGFVKDIHSRALGVLGLEFGIGRIKMEDSISPAEAFEVLVSIGDKVSRGDLLARIHTNKEWSDDKKKLFKNSFVLSDKAVKPKELLWEILN